MKVLLKIEIQVSLRKDACRRQQKKSFVVSRFIFTLNLQGMVILGNVIDSYNSVEYFGSLGSGIGSQKMEFQM